MSAAVRDPDPETLHERGTRTVKGYADDALKHIGPGIELEHSRVVLQAALIRAYNLGYIHGAESPSQNSTPWTTERGIKRIVVVLSALAGPAWIVEEAVATRRTLYALDWSGIAVLWVVSCALLCGAFYTLRWVVRGFHERTR